MTTHDASQRARIAVHDLFIAVGRSYLLKDEPVLVEQLIEMFTAALLEVFDNRDQDWILAMVGALGADSGFKVPIVPTVEVFQELFAAIRAQANEVDDVL
jgi:hypothetical protein